ncbi:MAG: hypothetical protein WAM30_07465, partial [Candidatus Dormiibacterota bacterium]
VALFGLSTGTAGAAQARATSIGGGGLQLPRGFVSVAFTANGSVTQPDDITRLDHNLFVAYQNGVGSKGEPAANGQTESTVVEFAPWGSELASWNVVGKVDGMTADPAGHRIIATVDEDGNTSLYTIALRGWRSTVTHYTYDQNPLPHGGGTDSIAILHGSIYITASAPSPDANGTTYRGPALYRATLSGTTATVTPVLMDNSTAVDATTGKTVTLNLSDPDSSTIVPKSAPRFGGDLVLDSQADGEQIYIANPGTPQQTNTVLPLSTQVDDTAFASEQFGTLYVTDNSTNKIYAIYGPFQEGQVFTAVANDATVMPGTLGLLDLQTGAITAWAPMTNPHGLLYVPNDWARAED